MTHDLPELRFTLAHGQNQFFVELAEALAFELRALGVRAKVEVGELPEPREALVHVFLPPHEYVSHARYRPPADLLRRSIVISAEQPETHYFDANVALARDAGAVFDINQRAVRAYAAQGVSASLLRLGYTELWDPSAVSGRSDAEVASRDIDILFLGRLTPRRAVALASYADTLERFNCQFVLSDHERAHTSSGATFVAGERKRKLLARTKVLLNVHGEEQPYFEWLRIAEALSAGCAVASERASDFEPLEPGTHIAFGHIDSLGLLCSWLLEDDAQRERMSNAARELLATELPLSNAAERILAAALEIDAGPVPCNVMLATRQERARENFRPPVPSFEHQPCGRTALSDGEALILRGLKRELIALDGLARQLSRLDYALMSKDDPEPQTRLLGESRAWGQRAAPALTIVIPLYEQRHRVLGALRSLEDSTDARWEVVVVDDASTDGGSAAVAEWIDTHPSLPCRLVRHDVNRGLAAARNTGSEEARTDRVLMLDADNEVRRAGIGRLMLALDDDPTADFAYGMLERFSDAGVEGLVNTYPWDPERLRGGNYIDAFALIRRDALRAMGGYSSDPRLYGWEDYDLWVRMAQSGCHGAFVPQVVGRYRVGPTSMLSRTNLSTADAFAALAERAPDVMAGLRLPR